LAWAKTDGAKSGVESVASEAPANRLKLRRVISVIVTPRGYLGFLAVSK